MLQMCRCAELCWCKWQFVPSEARLVAGILCIDLDQIKRIFAAHDVLCLSVMCRCRWSMCLQWRTLRVLHAHFRSKWHPCYRAHLPCCSTALSRTFHRFAAHGDHHHIARASPTLCDLDLSSFQVPCCAVVSWRGAPIWVYIIIPFLSGIVGYVTNVIAIWMTFHPTEFKPFKVWQPSGQPIGLFGWQVS